MAETFSIGDSVEMTSDALLLKLHKQNKVRGKFVETGTIVCVNRNTGLICVSLTGTKKIQWYLSKFWQKTSCLEDMLGVKGN